MNHPLLKNCLRLGAIALYPVVNLLFVSLPAQADWNEFTVCSIRLQKTGISPEKSAKACADSLNPDDLSLCVARINYLTDITGETALNACFRSRRPLELAQCVGDIERETATEQEEQNVSAPEVLDYCRRSLLPLSFRDCVIGLSESHAYPHEREVLPVTLQNAMATCLQSRDLR